MSPVLIADDTVEPAPALAAPANRADAAPETVADGELLRRFLETRSNAAFTELVRRFGPVVYAVALRSLRDHHAAEDVFQAAFLTLARDAGKVRRTESLAAWLHGVTLRLARKALARRRRDRKLDLLMPHPMQTAVLGRLSEQFDQQLLDEELQRLPEPYHTVLVLHYLEGKTAEETGLALGTSEGVVRGRLQRGKRELRLRLLRRGVDLSAVLVAAALWQNVAQAAVSPNLVLNAAEGGLALARGVSFSSSCSPEAVHLALQETAMLTTGKLITAGAALVATAALGWFAHAGIGPQRTSWPDEISTLASSPRAADAGADQGVLLAQAPAAGKPADAAPPAPTGGPILALKYDDGKADGKKSIAGTGEMIQFTLPNKSQKLRGLRIHCARYGTAQPPDESAEISIVSADETQVVHTEMVPYGKFKRGESQWTTIQFAEPVAVPETFWVILQFNAEATKGVYVSFDASTGGKHSKTGVPGGQSKPVTTGGDWMVQAVLTPPE
jgi:RNA polymerase sigma factor (sigma-70 family)